MILKELHTLDGKLRRTVYAIVWEDLLRKTDTMNEKEIRKLIRGIKSAINDAVDESMDYMLEHKIVL